MTNRIKIGLMLGATYAIGWTPAYAQTLEVTQNASVAAREVGTAPEQPQAVAPDQAESTDSTSSVGIGDIVVMAQRRAENVQQVPIAVRSEEQTSELQSLMRIS